jgi:hypothetical protein
MRYWAGLHPVEAQKLIKYGVEVMMRVAIRLLGKQDAGNPPLMLCGAESDEEQEDEDA